jgi:2'-5' RNA ligase
LTDKTAQRLFFALWPDPQTAGSIARVCADLGGDQGRRLAAAKLHLTLAFMGTASDEQQACYCGIADAIRGRSFTLQLDQCGHFPRPQVVWLGSSQIPVPLADLQRSLVDKLVSQCGYVAESRPFAPHITVRRKVRRFRVPDAVAPISWPVSEFVLACSRTLNTGAEYSVLRRWSLSAD